jgi:hypothetical protein
VDPPLADAIEAVVAAMRGARSTRCRSWSDRVLPVAAWSVLGAHPNHCVLPQWRGPRAVGVRGNRGNGTRVRSLLLDLLVMAPTSTLRHLRVSFGNRTGRR